MKKLLTSFVALALLSAPLVQAESEVTPTQEVVKERLFRLTATTSTTSVGTSIKATTAQQAELHFRNYVNELGLGDLVWSYDDNLGLFTAVEKVENAPIDESKSEWADELLPEDSVDTEWVEELDPTQPDKVESEWVEEIAPFKEDEPKGEWIQEIAPDVIEKSLDEKDEVVTEWIQENADFVVEKKLDETTVVNDVTKSDTTTVVNATSEEVGETLPQTGEKESNLIIGIVSLILLVIGYSLLRTKKQRV